VELYSFHAFGSARALTAITHQYVTNLFETALQIVALELLTVLIPVTALFWKNAIRRIFANPVTFVIIMGELLPLLHNVQL